MKIQRVFTFANGMCRLSIRVKPNSPKSKIVRFNEDRQVLEIALNAPPRDGEANEALIDLFKTLLRIPKDKIKIVSGLKSREKVVEIACTPESIEKLLTTE